MSLQSTPMVCSAVGLAGTWRRSLMVDAAGHEDRDSSVVWVQGPRLYVDLRLPASGSDEAPDGFAGEFTFRDDYFVWSRLIDVRPPSAVEDAGTLHLADADQDMMIEHGVHTTYSEHWHRDGGSVARSAAVLLRDISSAETAIVVRADDVVGFARAVEGSSGVVGIGSAHAARLTTASSAALVGPFGLRIAGDTATTVSGAEGSHRHWRVEHLEGSVDELLGGLTT